MSRLATAILTLSLLVNVTIGAMLWFGAQAAWPLLQASAYHYNYGPQHVVIDGDLKLDRTSEIYVRVDGAVQVEANKSLAVTVMNPGIPVLINEPLLISVTKPLPVQISR